MVNLSYILMLARIMFDFIIWAKGHVKICSRKFDHYIWDLMRLGCSSCRLVVGDQMAGKILSLLIKLKFRAVFSSNKNSLIFI